MENKARSSDDAEEDGDGGKEEGREEGTQRIIWGIY